MMRRAIGGVLLAVAVLGLGFVEWRAGRGDQALAELRAVLVDADPAGIVPSDVPVRLAGEARATAAPADSLLGRSAAGLRLDRVVEMRQWRETVEGSGQDRVARHEQVWSAEVIDSRRFLDRAPVNPAALPLASERFHADARLGRIQLEPQVLDLLPATVTLTPGPDAVTAAGRVLAPLATHYQSGDPAAPAIGDIRVRHELVPPGPVTVVGSLRDGRLGPWVAPNGTPVLLAGPGLRLFDELAGDRRLAALPALWGARFAFGVLALVGVAALGGRAGRAAPLVALAIVALAVAVGWLLFRTPLGWP